jgi:hypothetical protein
LPDLFIRAHAQVGEYQFSLAMFARYRAYLPAVI